MLDDLARPWPNLPPVPERRGGKPAVPPAVPAVPPGRSPGFPPYAPPIPALYVPTRWANVPSRVQLPSMEPSGNLSLAARAVPRKVNVSVVHPLGAVYRSLESLSPALEDWKARLYTQGMERALRLQQLRIGVLGASGAYASSLSGASGRRRAPNIEEMATSENLLSEALAQAAALSRSTSGVTERTYRQTEEIGYLGAVVKAVGVASAIVGGALIIQNIGGSGGAGGGRGIPFRDMRFLPQTGYNKMVSRAVGDHMDQD